MQLVTADAVARGVLAQVRAPAEPATLVAPEVITALLRRPAGFHCPCAARTLVDAVFLAAGRWMGEDPREEIRELLDRLVICGDLVEIPGNGAEEAGPLVYLAAPAFLLRESGAVYLQGVVPDHPTGLPDELTIHLQIRGVTRVLPPRPDSDWAPLLTEAGFAPVSRDHWLGAPAPTSAHHHRARYDKQLDTAPEGGDTGRLSILAPESDPTYYIGRWVDAGDRRGRFVGRREVKFGRRIWCYAEIGGGRILKLCDIHAEDDPMVGPSEAWHLQMALDACAGTPQRYRLRPPPADSDTREVEVDLFSSLPRWAERRFETLGRRLPKAGRGAMVTYAFPKSEVEEELRFLATVLWLQPRTDEI